MKGFTTAEWEFLRSHIEKQLRSQKLRDDGVSDYQALL